MLKLEKEIKNFDSGNSNCEKNRITLSPNQCGTIILRKFYQNSKAEFANVIYSLFTEDKLIELCNSKGKQNKCGEHIVAKEFAHDLGFAIVFTNNSKNNLTLKLIFDVINLEIKNEDVKKNELYLYLKPKENKLINLKSQVPEKSFSFAYKFTIDK